MRRERRERRPTHCVDGEAVLITVALLPYTFFCSPIASVRSSLSAYTLSAKLANMLATVTEYSVAMSHVYRTSAPTTSLMTGLPWYECGSRRL